jgi:hypothetical protein
VSTSVLIKVTQQHIERGEANHCCECPVALAAAEAFPHAEKAGRNGVVVTGYGILLALAGRELLLSLPEEVADFIAAFDYGQPVEPFEFTVQIPEGLTP